MRTWPLLEAKFLLSLFVKAHEPQGTFWDFGEFLVGPHIIMETSKWFCIHHYSPYDAFK